MANLMFLVVFPEIYLVVISGDSLSVSSDRFEMLSLDPKNYPIPASLHNLPLKMNFLGEALLRRPSLPSTLKERQVCMESSTLRYSIADGGWVECYRSHNAWRAAFAFHIDSRTGIM
jgi:hypothetical protein